MPSQNRRDFMFVRKLISTSLLYILLVVTSSTIRIMQGVSDPQNHLGLGLWSIIAVPVILIWSLLSVGIDRIIPPKDQSVLSFAVHVILLGSIFAMSWSYFYYLKILLFQMYTVFVFSGAALFWVMDRLVFAPLFSKEAINFYIHKLLVSIVVTTATVIYYFFQYPYFEFYFLNGIYELPLIISILLTLFAPLSWIIDFQSKKTNSYHWVSLIFHLLFGFIYAGLDYYVSHSLEVSFLIIGQVLLFWLFTRIIPMKLRNNISHGKGNELSNKT